MIWVSDPQRFEGAHFHALHATSSISIIMVMAEQVENAVNDQMSGVIQQALTLLFGLAPNHARCKNDIAEKAAAMAGMGRKGKDIGWLILGAPLPIKRCKLRIAGEGDREIATRQIDTGDFESGTGGLPRKPVRAA